MPSWGASWDRLESSDLKVTHRRGCNSVGASTPWLEIIYVVCRLGKR